MFNLNKFLLFAFFSLFLIGFASAINECGLVLDDVNSSVPIFLNANLNISTENGVCLSVLADTNSNLEIDCNYNWINLVNSTGNENDSPSLLGFNSNDLNSLTLRNCNIDNNNSTILNISGDLNYFNFYDSNIYTYGENSLSFLFNESNINSVNINFSNSYIDINDSALFAAIDSNINLIRFSNAGIVNVNDPNASFFTEGSGSDLNYIVIESLEDITNKGSFISFSGVMENFIDINLNNNLINQTNGNLFSFEKDEDTGSQIIDLNIYNLLITGTDSNLINMVDSNISNLKIYDSNITLNTFATLDSTSNILDGVVYNNVFYLLSAGYFFYANYDQMSGLDFNSTYNASNYAKRSLWFSDSIDSNATGGNLWLFDSNSENLCNDNSTSNIGICDSNISLLLSDGNYLYDNLPLFEANIDLNSTIVTDYDNGGQSDGNVNYGSVLTLTISIFNLGDTNANNDFNLVLSVGGVDKNTIVISNNLNPSGSLDSNISWTVDSLTSDVNVCVEYDNDSNQLNNCTSAAIHVRSVDMNAISLTLDDSSVDENTSVTATLSYKNSGDLNADSNYSVLFYRDTTLITDCNFIISNDLNSDANTTKTCTFTSPSVTANTTYTIKGIVNYTGDSNVDNNSATASLTVANVTTSATTSSSSGGSSESSDSGIDLDAVSLVYPGESVVGKEVSFKFTYKNIGDEDLTSSYIVKIIITQKGETIKTLSQTITEDLESNASKTYTLTWTPTKVGYYSLEALVDFSDDDDTGNDYIDDKLIHVVSSTTTATTTSTSTTTTTITPSTVNKLISDLNSVFKDLNLDMPSDLNSNLYTGITITRDFNCGITTAVKPYCNITVNLHNSGDKNIVGYTYYEILPNLKIDDRTLRFDINSLDVNKDYKLTYSLASNVDKNLQSKFLGLMLTEDVLEPKNDAVLAPKYTIPWNTIGTVIAIVVGVAILGFLIYALVSYLRNRSPRRYVVHEDHDDNKKWSGWSTDNGPKMKYKGGNYKSNDSKHSGPKYKGWK